MASRWKLFDEAHRHPELIDRYLARLGEIAAEFEVRAEQDRRLNEEDARVEAWIERDGSLRYWDAEKGDFVVPDGWPITD